MTLLCLLLLSSWTLLAGPTKPSSHASITVHLTDPKPDSVQLSTPDLFTLTPISLKRTKVNAHSKVTLTISLTQALFAHLLVGSAQYRLLLKPGDKLDVYITHQPKESVRFVGSGSLAARYLVAIQTLGQTYETRAGKPLAQLEASAFHHRLDSMRQAYAHFTQRFVQQHGLDSTSWYWLEQRNRLQLLWYDLNYTLAQYAPADTSSSAIRAYQRVVSQVPLESSLLQAHPYEYGFVLAMYFQAAIYNPLMRGQSSTQMTTLLTQLPRLADQQLCQQSYPPAIRTFLRAKNVIESLKRGLSPTIDSVLALVKGEASYQRYASAITQRYQHWQALTAGRVAPNFSGFTPGGSVLSLSDLKGRVVYVDVWATWCVPCRAEFPSAKQLQKRFLNNAQVVFLYVSIDRNATAWRQYLARNPAFTGIHINQRPGVWYDAFWQAYQLSSIPRYLLIDQAGRLVDGNAARPSSEVIGSQIEQLLH